MWATRSRIAACSSFCEEVLEAGCECFFDYQCLLWCHFFWRFVGFSIHIYLGLEGFKFGDICQDGWGYEGIFDEYSLLGCEIWGADIQLIGSAQDASLSSTIFGDVVKII